MLVLCILELYLCMKSAELLATIIIFLWSPFLVVFIPAWSKAAQQKGEALVGSFFLHLQLEQETWQI